MSGHSKWATIKHQKATNDKARGQAFSKLSRAISVAVAAGRGEKDPDKNFRLRLAIERAREVNMPKVNIERAIDRGAGQDKEKLIAVRFEGYGPGGVGIIVEAITDNRQRTIQEMKNIFERNGGSLATPGAVAYNFTLRGQILVQKEQDEEKQVLALMDIDGIDDVELQGGSVRVLTKKDKLMAVKKAVADKGSVIISSSLVMMPKRLFSLKDPQKVQKINDFIKRLEDHNDVQEVFTNLGISS